MNSIQRLKALSLAAGAALALSFADAGTLDKVGQDKALRIAYREDAPPFSFTDEFGLPAGFMIDLCKAVAKHIGEQLAINDLKIAYVLVTAENRFDAIENGKADLLCEPTSVTLSRRKRLGFSIPTFVDGASLLVGGDAPSDFAALSGKKIGVLAGTTTEKGLRDTLASANLTAEVTPAKTHQEGLAMLDKGEIVAYFADRAILSYLASKSSDPSKLRLADNYFSSSPMLWRCPAETRISGSRSTGRSATSIARARSRSSSLTRSASAIQPSDVLKTLYSVSALPD